MSFLKAQLLCLWTGEVVSRRFDSELLNHEAGEAAERPVEAVGETVTASSLSEDILSPRRRTLSARLR